jgi:hypothetical protein
MRVVSSRHRWRTAIAVAGAAMSLLLAPVGARVAQADPGDWTLSKTANPTTFSTAGQVINYTYVITNVRGQDGHITSFIDDRATVANCPPGTPVPPAGRTCSGTYTTTAADVAAGSVTNHATVSGDPCNDGCSVTATAQATITFRAPPALNGSITIVKTASGGDNTFNFTSTIPGAASFTLTTAGGNASRVFSNLTAGTYTVSEAGLPLNWRLSTLTCTGDTGGAPTTTNLAGRTASIGLDGGEAIICTFGNVFDFNQQRLLTQDIISQFLSHRVRLLIDDEPDRARFLRRIPGSLWGEDDGANGSTTASTPLSFSGASGPFSSQMSFSTSTSRIAQAHQDVAAASEPGSALAYALPVKAPERRPAPASGWDVWVETHVSAFNANAGGFDSRGNFAIAYVGADYLVNPWLLVGALAQFDWAGERLQTVAFAPTSTASGQGAMAGPYVGARITPNLFIDARAAWGVSDNRVTPFGTFTDSFTTDRWLASANLTGNWRFGNFRVTPTAGVSYIQETQHNYTDSMGVPIPAQTVALGRFSIGPEFAYRIIQPNGFIFEPMVSIKGNWDFQRPDARSVDGIIVAGDELHAKVQAGVLARAPNGVSVRTVFSYDGIGSGSFHELGGQVWVSVPLQ